MIEFFQQHMYEIIAILLVIYEVTARDIPTEGNWSIIHRVVMLLDWLLKNKAPQGEHTVATVDEPKSE